MTFWKHHVTQKGAFHRYNTFFIPLISGCEEDYLVFLKGYTRDSKRTSYNCRVRFLGLRNFLTLRVMDVRNLKPGFNEGDTKESLSYVLPRF